MANDTTYEQPGAVPLGGRTAASFTQKDEQDWFKIDVVAGKRYVLRMLGQSADAGTLAPHAGGEQLTVFKAEGQILVKASSFGHGKLPVLGFVAETTGSYMVSAHAALDTGSYTLSLAEAANDDTGDDAAHAATLAMGAPLRGDIEMPGDTDMFRIEHEAGKDLIIQIDSAPGADSSDLHPWFLDADGKAVYMSAYTMTDTMKSFIFTGTAPVRYVSVRGDLTSGNGVYQITVFQPARDAHSDRADTTGVLPVNGLVSGVIDYAGDVDAFRVSLHAGMQYAVDLYAAASGAGTFVAGNRSVEVYDPHLNRIYSYDPSGTLADGRFVVKALSSGDYLVKVRNVDTGRSTGTYSLGAIQLTGDGVAPLLKTGPAVSMSSTGKLSLVFNELVKADGAAFSLTGAGGEHVLDSSKLSVTALHNVVHIDPAQFLRPGVAYTLTIKPGGVRDLNGNAYDGVDAFTVQVNALPSAAGSGNDLLAFSGTGNYVDGGAGVDAVVLTGSRADYQLIALADGRLQLLPVGGGASEVLVNVERIYFADQALALDVNANAGAAYRLYQAAFNRTPDGAGVGFWMNQIDNGTSPKAVAQAFVGSAEFQLMYGSFTSNKEFVDLLYANVLHRPGEAAGVAYWKGLLDGGLSRADVLLAFSDAPENVAAVAQVVGQGFAFTPI
jgi:hypothetical protein